MSRDSGLDTTAALKRFFIKGLPALEDYFDQADEDDEPNDPTLDLDDFISSSLVKPQAENRTNSTFDIANEKRDSSLEELELIVGEIKKKSSYGHKLSDIMLKGLKKTLGQKGFEMFEQSQMPENWMPIIRMNNDNTPYVEFIVKSDLSDQDPMSQLHDYTLEHASYGQYVLNHLRSTVVKPTERIPINHNKPGPYSEPRLRRPMSSTPIAQSKSLQKRGASLCVRSKENLYKQDLNDSKRVLPSRACKAVVSVGQYKYS